MIYNYNMSTKAKRDYSVTPDGRAGNSARMSLRMKGKPKSLEHRQKIGKGVAAACAARNAIRDQDAETARQQRLEEIRQCDPHIQRLIGANHG